MTEGTDLPIGTARASTPAPIDDALPTRVDPSRGNGGGGVGNRASGGGDGSGLPEPTPAEKPWAKVVVEWGAFIAAIVVCYFVVNTFVFQAFYIPSESMVPTLEIGDRVLVSKLSYHLHDVHRGDIIVFKAPEGTRTAEIKDLVKRVIGLPGDRIVGRNSRIYIDGKILDEPWLPGVQSREFQCTAQLGCVNGRVPADSVFVLGDNRLNSKDSTYFGPIKQDGIIGRAFVRIWPLDRLAFIGPSYLVPMLVLIVLIALFFIGTSLWSSRRTRSRSP